MRFDLIDGIRGHLLIGMLVAHLSFHPGMNWLVTYHHHAVFAVFDAEFFVTISGFLVGYLARKRIGIPVDHVAARFAFARYLGRRVATVFSYHFLSSMALILLLGSAAFSWQGALSTAADILTFQASAKFSGVLILYILCFVLLIAGVLVFGLRPGVVVLASALLYLASQFTFIRGFWGLGGGIMAFDVAAWQFPFVAAFALGYYHEAIGRAVSALPDWAALGLVAGLFAFSLWLGSVWITPPFADVPPEMPRHWPRPQLHPYHLLKITVLGTAFTILLTGGQRWLAWPRAVAAGYFRLGVLRNIGRYSIRMFVLHLVLIAVFVFLFDRLAADERDALALGMIAFFILAPTLVTVLAGLTARTKARNEIRP